MTNKKISKEIKQTDVISAAHKKNGIIGRDHEMIQIWNALAANRNVLIEGPVGVGKTVLAQTVANLLGKKVIRIDGDSRFTEQKLTGWFDPSLVVKKGYSAKTFFAGPLLEAMQTGSILFINELNRMPEAVQNILLPAIDEMIIHVPQLGEIRAKKGFSVVATQNPREFVATSHLSEALMDRMEWVHLGYQTFEEEFLIAKNSSDFKDDSVISKVVQFIRLTRSHPKIKRGASVRAAIAVLSLLAQRQKQDPLTEKDFWEVLKLALPTRIELNTTESESGYDQFVQQILAEIWDEVKKKHI